MVLLVGPWYAQGQHQETSKFQKTNCKFYFPLAHELLPLASKVLMPTDKELGNKGNWSFFSYKIRLP
jgi:hypothetical protein